MPGLYSERAVAFSLGSVAMLLAFFIPSFAAAQASSVTTQELLPPGQNTCREINVTGVQPYIYAGLLESFDVTISDTQNSYVGAFASVGNTSVSLDSITRWAGEPGGLRIHVDTPDVRVGAGLPVKLTLLASLPGQPTCVTIVTFEAAGTSMGATSVSYPSVSTVTGNTMPVSSSAVPSIGASQQMNANTSAARSNHMNQNTGSSTQKGSGMGLLGASVAPTSGPVINGLCSGSNVYRLWFILLAIYVVLVAVVVFAEPWYLSDSVLGSTATILVPLIALLAFWYFSAACRGASWIPVVACVIAIVGLFLAFREYETTPLLAAPSES